MMFYVKAVVAATFYSASRSLRAFFLLGAVLRKQTERIKDPLHFLFIKLELIVKIFRKVIKRLTSPFLFC